MSIHDDGSGSTRVLDDGSREEAGWLWVGEERVFHVTRVPAERPRAWVLLCPAIGGEHDGGYRRQTLLARTLTTLGIATRRIHYRGTGNSHLSTVTERDTMVADARVAAADLAARFPDAEGVVLGERMGALVAAEVATDGGARHLVLWHPVLDVEIYLRELLRAGELQRVAAGAQDTGGDLRSGYEQGEGDLVGFSVPKALLDSFTGHLLVDAAPAPTCSVHVMQFGRKRIDPRTAEVVDRWREHGVDVEVHLLGEAELWWFAPGPWKRGEEGRPVTVEVIDATVELLTTNIGREGVLS